MTRTSSSGREEEKKIPTKVRITEVWEEAMIGEHSPCCLRMLNQAKSLERHKKKDLGAFPLC
jgi:hypothetical protein